jgi:hypothetical protein
MVVGVSNLAFGWRSFRYAMVAVGIGVVEIWLIGGYLHPPGEDQPFQFVPAMAAALAAASFGYEWRERDQAGAMVTVSVLVVSLLAATSFVLTSFVGVGRTDAGEPQGPLIFLIFLPVILLFVVLGAQAGRTRL